jgi:hypothetical protein
MVKINHKSSSHTVFYLWMREREREHFYFKFSGSIEMTFEILFMLQSIPNLQIEESYLQNNVKGVTAYFGGAACH